MIWLIAVTLLAITVIAYAPIFNAGFVNYDDIDYVTRNSHVQSGLTVDGVKWAFTTFRASNWHPLTWLSLMADAQIYKLNPRGYHLTSLLIHLLNTLILLIVLSKLTGSLWKSGFVAALFAVHPLHVESVAWISERKDVLSTFFWLTAIWAYSEYVKSKNTKTYILTLVLFALGLMAKPMVVTLPLTLLILDWWPLGRIRTLANWKQVVVEKLPMFAISAASAVVTIIAQQQGGAVNSIERLGIGIRAANAAWSYAAYIVKMVWPSNLAVPYPHPKDTLPIWQVALATVALVSISSLVIAYAKRKPYLPAGWLWYLITLTPVVGLLQVGSQGMADRYTYVPLIGIFMMIAYGVPKMNTHLTKALTAALSAVAIVSLAAVSYSQVRVWKNSHTLFKHSIACTQNNYIAHNNLGAVLADEGKSDEAAKHYRTALSIEPGYAAANANLGVWLTRQNRLDEAIYYFHRALKADPNSADAHNGLGVALAKKGYLTAAMKEFTAALRINPESNSTKQNLAVIRYLIATKESRTAHQRKNAQPD